MNFYHRIIILIILFLSFSLVSSAKVRKIYIEKYKDIAIKQMKSHGIPASIILAQACLESGNGTSRLATKGNNHFGIKCHDWTGPSMRHDDDKRRECFRKYRHPKQSFQDHSKFLTTRGRYSFLFDLNPTDYRAWAYGLKKAGYATHPKYPQLLISIIEANNLDQYDRGSKRHKYSKTSSNKKSYKSPTHTAILAPIKIEPIEKHFLYRYSTGRKIYEINKTSFIIVGQGDTYSRIAKEYRLFKREVLSFNDLKKEVQLKTGEVVYLEKKRRKASRSIKTHITTNGETMYHISQKYGIRLKYLYHLNGMKKDTEPTIKTVLKLR